MGTPPQECCRAKKNHFRASMEPGFRAETALRLSGGRSFGFGRTDGSGFDTYPPKPQFTILSGMRQDESLGGGSPPEGLIPRRTRERVSARPGGGGGFNRECCMKFLFAFQEAGNGTTIGSPERQHGCRRADHRQAGASGAGICIHDVGRYRAHRRPGCPSPASLLYRMGLGF